MSKFFYSAGFLSTLLLTAVISVPSSAIAHGTVNGGKCYNGWHLKNGRCHKPHKEDNEKRYIKNGGKCYNGWFLDTKTGKCVESRGFWGWLTD